MKLSRISSLAALAGAALVQTPALAQACAMCGLSPGDHEISAFNASVLFMLSAPYVIFAVIGGTLFVAYRMALRRRRAATETARKPSLAAAPIATHSEATS